MDLLEIIKSRRSIRKFKNQAIPRKIINQLMQALIWAPSAGNLQARKFYFVFRPAIKQELVEAALNQNFIAQAPLVIVACLDKRIKTKYAERGEKIYAICDVAMAVENLLLLAYHLGLGTCPVSAFNEKLITAILNLPNYFKPILIIPVGYAAEKPSAPSRLAWQDLIEVID